MLGGVSAGLAAGSAGCLQYARSLANRESPEQVSVTIKTVPADDDEAAVQIARTLQKNMTAVGIDADIELVEITRLFRDVLLNQAFDVYVGQFPPYHDPDFLRSALHSTFVTEQGWQNPFGVSDLGLDEQLTAQRTTAGADRQRTVADVANSVAEIQPFATVCFPEEITVARTDRFGNWDGGRFAKPISYLTLDQAESGPDDATTLGLVLTDDRITKNLNPIAVEYRRPNPLTDLLYDPLMRREDGDVRPWLAGDVTWRRTEATGVTATVELREETSFHDGEALTAADVVFTYRFLDDTSLGTGDMHVPSPTFRGRTSLVESIERLDDRTVQIGFGETTEEVAVRALTVPILPAHVWEAKTGSANLAGIDISEGVTQALVWANTDPVGSGPFRLESRTPAERLVLSRFDDHPLIGTGPEQFDVPFERIAVQVAPSDGAAASLVTEGTVDATGDPVHPKVLENVTGEEPIERFVADSRAFYHVGFNARREPFGNVRFRQALARLLDSEHVAETVFDGYAAPAATPLAGTSWEPPEFRWDGTDPVVPFAGTDGDLDAPTARATFREAGYAYDSDEGRLLK
ncbi:extracellular solute-binding protein, family 5 [Halorhabdus tiamatea SARL4B]|uniref:Extracellular solute-binding protein, family 5 n=1 Tax=Halorhabdus tiamatea SARL4B TaxID=1033806 RepID=S6D2I1_9EURY|nr:extracellular solute-binding protein, family 5 [Halorhabdus tiamatea SARL4B]